MFGNVSVFNLQLATIDIEQYDHVTPVGSQHVHTFRGFAGSLFHVTWTVFPDAFTQFLKQMLKLLEITNSTDFIKFESKINTSIEYAPNINKTHACLRIVTSHTLTRLPI